MSNLQSFEYGSLQYMDTQEFRMESRVSKEIVCGNFSIFAFVLKGSIRVSLGLNQAVRSGHVGYGEVFLIPSRCTCSLSNTDNQPSRLILIRFRGETNGEWSDSNSASHNITPFIQMNELQLYHFRMPRVHTWVKDLLNGPLLETASHQYLAHSFLYTIAAEFMTMLENPKITDDHLIDYIVQVKQTMIDQIHTVFDVKELAQLSGTSYARFYQVFKGYTGLSPLQYMTTIKLNQSLRLLANNPSSIMEVAHSVGYSDELYFSRLFKKYMGLSPSEYAVLAKKRVVILSPVYRGDLSVLGITPVLMLHRGWNEEPEIERYVTMIEQCQPDYIVTSPISDELYNTLSQICPVVMINWKGYPWKERLLQISRLLEMPTIAERWLTSFQIKVKNAQLHVSRSLGSEPFLIVSVHNTFYRVYGMKRIKIKDLFYDELCLKPPSAAYDITFLDVQDLSQIAGIDCDNVLFLTPASLPEETCLDLEEEWLGYKRNGRKKHCIFIHHEEPLLYNAEFYDRLIDQFVHYMITLQ